MENFKVCKFSQKHQRYTFKPAVARMLETVKKGIKAGVNLQIVVTDEHNSRIEQHRLASKDGSVECKSRSWKDIHRRKPVTLESPRLSVMTGTVGDAGV